MNKKLNRAYIAQVAVSIPQAVGTIAIRNIRYLFIATASIVSIPQAVGTIAIINFFL